MNLIVDVGNTATKAGIFDKGQLVAFYQNMRLEDWHLLLDQYTINNAIVSNVGSNTNEFLGHLSAAVPVLNFTPQLPLPFDNHYQTPLTLGPDRLAGVAGAQALCPNHNCLVIDMGSCITYDFINAQGQYKGGGISLGLRLKLKALHNFTAKLPLVELRQDIPLIGTTTEDAILSGVVNGTLAEIEGIISNYNQQFPDLKVLICGGDANFFESKLKASIFVNPHLVLIGLNRILEFNVRI